MKHILICGSRDWSDRARFDRAMATFVAKHGLPEIVTEGCARGADLMADAWATAHSITVDHHPAHWDTEGIGAGFNRNKRMLDTGPEAIIAFTDNLRASRGTNHMVLIARKAGVPVWVPIPQQGSGVTR